MARNRSRSAEGFEENMKKAFTEMLVLLLLSERDHYIGELSDAIVERSGHTILIRRPYAVILRLAEANPPYVDEVKRREGPEARIRQYYRPEWERVKTVISYAGCRPKAFLQ